MEEQEVTGASADADRATQASPQAPAGLGHPVSVPSAVARHVPENKTDYIVAGKPYPLRRDDADGLFSIIDEDGDELICLWRGCAHLDGGDWERVPASGSDAEDAR